MRRGPAPPSSCLRAMCAFLRRALDAGVMLAFAAGVLVAATDRAIAAEAVKARPARPQPVVLVVGDSISAGYGLEAGQGWVDLLAARLRRGGHPQHVVNASISGDTTAGGRARLPTLLREHRPTIVILELGANDGLRGSDLAAMRTNLEAMVEAAQAAHARVLLLGMRLPPNYGPAYTREFGAIFAEVARARNVALVPWLFDGFGTDLSQFQADHIHPIAAAEPRILDNVWPVLLPLIETRAEAAPRRSAR